jgi:hypothetical protein
MDGIFFFVSETYLLGSIVSTTGNECAIFRCPFPNYLPAPVRWLICFVGL